jgi:phosphate:Na+ symporter
MQSSVTTVMTVGLVNSGIMKLSQSAGVMICANLGTTATAWLLSLNSLGGGSGSLFLQFLQPATFAPFLAIGGIVAMMFTRSNRTRSIATILVGFSVMMIGMNVMSVSVSPLQNVPSFKQLMISFSNPFLGVIVGILATLLIQSSAAAIGILQALAMSVGVTYAMAIPIVCGAQISTCLTAILASAGAGNDGKRAALIHLFYNLLRNTGFLVIFYVLNAVAHFPFMGLETGAVGIAAVHTLLNVAGCIVFLPLADRLLQLIMRVLPYSKAEQEEQADTLTILNPIFLANPPFAIDQVRTAAGMLADVVKEYFAAYLRSITDDDPRQQKKVRALGRKASRYADQLRKYCIGISGHRMQDREAGNLSFLQSTINDYAEIADKIKGMRSGIDAFRHEGGVFSEEARRDLDLFGKAAQEILDVTVHEYGLQNLRLASTIQVYREIITDIHGKISKKHVRRLHSGACRAQNNLLFSEICVGYEQIIDRCDSIAGHILTHSQKPAKQLTDEQYRTIKDLFGDKYSILDE